MLSLFALTFLPSCNEESDHSADDRITSQLPGTWVLTESQPNPTENDDENTGTNDDEDENTLLKRNVNFTFTTSAFNVTVTRKTISKTMYYNVRGTWNVKNQILQLRYDINSLTTMGMSSQEITALRNSFNDNNLLLDDIKNSDQAYGMPIELSRPNNANAMMKLSKNYDLGGIYTLYSGAEPQ